MPFLQVLISVSMAFCAYLLGSLCTAILVCMVIGLPDPRAQGSGNPGTSNVLRLYGRGPAALTLSGDVLKGVLPVLVAQWMGLAPVQQGLIGCAAVLGHIYPVFFRFEGGKGIATACGVLMVLAWKLGLALLLVWIAVVWFTRTASLAALAAGTTAPILGLAFFPEHFITTLALFGITCLRHIDNIKRIRAGEELVFARRQARLRSRGQASPNGDTLPR